MSNRPPLNWNQVRRDLDGDRLTRSEVREEHIRSAGMRGIVGLALSAWRGQSGRRYVVAIVPLADFDPADAAEAVVLFVKRNASGTADIVVHACDLDAVNASVCAGVAEGLAATEVHLHRIEPDAARRAAIVDDLRTLEVEAA